MKTLPHIKQLLVAILVILTTTTCTFEWDNPYDELGNNYNEGTAPAAQFSANKTDVVVGEVITFTNQSKNTDENTQFTWNFGDGTVYNAIMTSKGPEEPTHSYSTQGRYTVSLVANNADGKSDTETKTDYIVVSTGSGTGTGTGTFEDPYDVANGIAKQGETGKWVKGYLVGVYETLDADGNNLADFAPSFEGPYNTPTNVIIAADAAETDITKCVIVQLPTGDIHNNTNLKENPANEDKEILYFGDLTSYFSSAGLKNTTGYWLDGAGIIPTEPEGFFIENFTTNLGQFSAYSAVGASQVWEWASYGSGCAVMSGYDGSNFANEDWLISPSISLVGKSNVVLNFTHAVNYLDDWNNIKVLASEDYSGTGDPTSATWTEITGWDQTQPGNSWTFFPSGEVAMTAFEGKTIYLAFKYISSTSGGSTWEVGDVSLSEK